MFESTTLGSVESELVELAGNLAAATCRFLQLLAEFDTREGWAGPGMRSCAHWLNWRVGLNLRTAREHLRVAHALAGLPEITAAFAAGRVSYAKVRALTRIATASTEPGLLNIALHGTASQVESVVAAARAQTDPHPAAAVRSLHWRQASDGSWQISLRLPAEDGAQLVAAIAAVLAEGTADTDDAVSVADPGPEESPSGRAVLEHQNGPAEPPVDPSGPSSDGSAEPPRAIAERRAGALLALVAGHTTAEPPTVIVHVRADLLDRADASNAFVHERPTAWIEGGPALPPTAVRRLMCGAAVQAMVVDDRGHPLHLGRRRRTVTPAQMRALRVRDHDRCVFAGCPSTRHLQAHHVRWWRHGGRTDLENLALVCHFHHHLIHDRGYQLRPDGQGGFVAARPDDRPIPAAGAPTRGHADAVHHPEVDDYTITPRWDGERLDLDYVLAWLVPALRAEGSAVAA